MKKFIFNTVILFTIVGQILLAQETTVEKTTMVLDSKMMIEKLNASLKEQQISLRKLTTSLEETKLKLEIAQERNEDLSSELSKDKNSRYSNLQSASKAQLTAFSQSAEYLRDRLAHRDREIGKAEATIASLKAKLASLKESTAATSFAGSDLITQRLASLEKQNRVQTEAINRFIQGAGNMGISSGSTSAVSALVASPAGEKSNQSAVNDLKKQLAEATAQIKELQTANQSKAKQISQYQSESGDLKKSVASLEKQLESAKSDSEAANKNLKIKHQVAQNLIDAQKAELLKLKSQKEEVVVNQIPSSKQEKKDDHLNQRLLDSQKNARQLAATNGALVKEVESLKQQLAAEQKNASANKESAKQIASIKKELTTEADKNKGLLAQIVGLQSQLKEAVSGKQDSKQLSEKINQLSSENKTVAKQLAEAQNSLASKDATIEKLNAALSKKGKQLSKEIGLHSNNMHMLSSFRSKYSSVSKELAIAQTSASASEELSAQLKSMRSKLDTTKNLNLELKTKISHLEKQLSSERADNQSLDKKIKSLIETHKKENSKLKGLVSTSDEKTESSQAELAKVKKERDALANKISSLTSKSSKLETQFISFQDKKKASDLELVKAKAELEDLQKLIRQQDAELLIMSDKVKSSTATDGEKDQKLSSLQNKLKATEESTEVMKVELEAINQKLKKEQSSYKEAQQELDKVKTSFNDYRQKLEAREQELAELREANKKAVAEHEQTEKKLEEKQEEMSALLASSNQAITAKEEVLEQLQGKDKKIVELQQAKESVVAAKAELEELNLAVTAERDKALKQLNDGRSELKTLKNSNLQFTSSIADLSAQLKKSSEERNLRLASLATETSKLKSELDKTKQALKAEQTAKLALEKTLADEKNAKVKLSGQLEKKSQETVRLAKLGDTKAIEIASAHRNIEQSEARVKQLEGELANLEGVKKKLEASIKEMKVDQEKAAKLAESTQNELKDDIKKSNDGLKQLSKEMSSLRDQIKKQSRSLEQQQGKSDQLTAALEEQINIQENTRSILYQIDPIFFESAQSNFDYVQQATVLNQAKKILEIFPDAKFRVTGHTDNVGDPQTNLELSKTRAANFVNYLVSNGIDEESITHAGIGQNRPLESNDTWEGRAKNRRVEVEVYSE